MRLSDVRPARLLLALAALACLAAVPASGELTVTGLPAGSSVSLFLRTSAGEDVIASWEVPAEGTAEADGPVVLAPPQQFGPLAAGSGALLVKHPTLGRGSMPVAIAPGAPTTLAFDWRRLDPPRE